MTCVRLILRQPSSAWSSFSLENIQIHQQREQVDSYTHTHLHVHAHDSSQARQVNQLDVASLSLQEQQVRSEMLDQTEL